MRALLLMLLLSSACGGRSLEQADPSIMEAEPSYQLDIRPLYARHCTSCHDSHGVRAGGVELDRYETARATRVKSACTSITSDLIASYGEFLLPYRGDPPRLDLVPCGDWEPLSMPAGAQPRLTHAEQMILVRWVVTGANP
jgi:hypothetical protein